MSSPMRGPAPSGKPDTADASPTKEFFIHLLTVDLDMIKAINDLVDNCVDGAKRLHSDGNFSGRTVSIKVSSKLFEIADNCGGISLEKARLYAFKFGKDKKDKFTDNSVGRFGVGMKRAVFKLGERFEVKSTTKKSFFTVKEDVNEWIKKIDWDYQLRDISETTQSDEKVGTHIIVTHLHEEVAESFEDTEFLNELRRELSTAHGLAIKQGLALTFQGTPVNFIPEEMLSDDEFEPALEKVTVKEKGSNVDVTIMAGVAVKSSPRDAGWNIYCNGRLVVRADKTTLSGWGDVEDDTKLLPQFHPQFNRFRGFVFFESKDPTVLPWNTTKSGINIDSGLYRGVRQRMVIASRNVIDYLNQFKTEKSKDAEKRARLDETISKAGKKDFTELRNKRPAASFRGASIAAEEDDESQGMTEISYERDSEKVAALQKALRVKSPKALGQKTFDMMYDLEFEE